jgi:hypothetical protein
LGIYFSSVNLTKFANVLEKLKEKPCICKFILIFYLSTSLAKTSYRQMALWQFSFKFHISQKWLIFAGKPQFSKFSQTENRNLGKICNYKNCINSSVVSKN